MLKMLGHGLATDEQLFCDLTDAEPFAQEESHITLPSRETGRIEGSREFANAKRQG